MKLLATDYDGTLRYGREVMQEDLDAIQEWKEAGNLFAVVTGRSPATIKAQAEQYNLPLDYLVCNNGGIIFDAQGNPLLDSILDSVAAVDIIYAMQEMDDVASIVANDGKNRYKLTVNPGLTDHRYAMQPAAEEKEAVLNLQKYCQLVVSMTDDAAAAAMAEQINHFFGNSVNAFANNTCVDVVPKGVSKAEGLTFIAAYADVDEDDVYAIGDGLNDVPMLQAAGHGAAIAMAPEEVQQEADAVYLSISDMIHQIMEA